MLENNPDRFVCRIGNIFFEWERYFPPDALFVERPKIILSLVMSWEKPLLISWLQSGTMFAIRINEINFQFLQKIKEVSKMAKKTVFWVFIFLFLFSTYSFADVIKLKFANFFPPMHRNSILMGQYCDELNKKLAGKVLVTHYAGGTLLTAPKIAGGVSSGIADIGLSHCAYSRGRFPVMEIMELPLGFPSSWIASHVANDFYAKFKPKEWGNFKVLMFSGCPPNVIQTQSKQVRNLDELQGLKIRGTGRIADILKALGATPMPLEMADLYDSLRRGVIDGNLGPIEQMKGWKVGEVQKYTTASWKIGGVFAFYVIMNKNKWDRLPADIQKVISDVTNDYNEKWGTTWNEIDIEGINFFKEQGGKIIQLSDTESAKWVKKVEPVIADYKKDLMKKGFKTAEIDTWLAYVKERIEYWKGQEKAKKIPTAYSY